MTASGLAQLEKQAYLEKQKQAQIEIAIKLEQRDREKVQQQHKTRIENLANLGLDGYYEYKVLSLLDANGIFNRDSGRVDIIKMTKVLNELGVEGWHLAAAYSNELGKNSSASGVGGMMFGTNSTVDENILIFERFVKIKQTLE